MVTEASWVEVPSAAGLSSKVLLMKSKDAPDEEQRCS
jgi:hypothetical protein